MAQRGSKYLEALVWIAKNDDTNWLDDEYGRPSVTACMVADLFGKKIERVTADLAATVRIVRMQERGLEETPP